MMFESSEQISGKLFQSSEAVSNPAFEISDEIVEKLLDKLSNDDEFRAVFLRSPRIALAYLGHEGATQASLGDAGIWACAQCADLASPATIRAARKIFKTQLMASLATKGVVGLNMSIKAS